MAANKKQPYSWSRVTPGDIISFRYKSIHGDKIRTHSILVLNPKINTTLKDGTRKRQLIGVKFEESNMVDLRLTQKEISILERVGSFDIVDAQNNIFKLSIDRKFLVNDIIGAKQRTWKILSRNLKILGQYRTYDYRTAKKSAVYLEPIRIFAPKYQKMIREEREKLKGKNTDNEN